MARRSKPSWNFFLEEFRCRGCGGKEAYHSRARGFFEKHLLSLFYMQTVRCERCDQRSYVFLTVEALDRVQFERKAAQGEPTEAKHSDGAKSDSRVA